MPFINLSMELILEITHFCTLSDLTILMWSSKLLAQIPMNYMRTYSVKNMERYDDLALWYFQQGVRSKALMEWGAKHANFTIVESCRLHGLRWSSMVAANSVKTNNIDFVKELMSYGLQFNEFSLSAAAETGFLHADEQMTMYRFVWNMFGSGNLKKAINVANIAALVKYTSLAFFKEWLIMIHPYVYMYRIALHTVEEDRLDLLQYMWENRNIQQFEQLVVRAVEKNNTGILLYLISQEWEKPLNAMTVAVTLGFVECVKILLQNGYFAHATLYDIAARRGNVEIMKRLRMRNVFITDTVCMSAIKHIECFKFAFECLYGKTLPHPEKTVELVYAKGSEECREFVSKRTFSRYTGKFVTNTTSN